MSRNLILLMIGLVLVAIALILWPIIRVQQLSGSFETVKTNDARELVLKRMGAPWKDEECGKYIGGQPAGCAEEFTYAHPYAPVRSLCPRVLDHRLQLNPSSDKQCSSDLSLGTRAATGGRTRSQT